MGEEGDVLHRGNNLIRCRFTIKKSLDDSSFDQMFLHQFRHILGFQGYINDAFRINDHNGAEGAKAVASRFNNFNLFR